MSHDRVFVPKHRSDQDADISLDKNNREVTQTEHGWVGHRLAYRDGQ
jgi:hypothetical protein